MNSSVHETHRCSCKAEIKKLTFEIEKFKSFHEDVEKKSRVVNSMLQVLSVKDKKPEIVQQIF